MLRTISVLACALAVAACAPNSAGGPSGTPGGSNDGVAPTELAGACGRPGAEVNAAVDATDGTSTVFTASVDPSTGDVTFR